MVNPYRIQKGAILAVPDEAMPPPTTPPAETLAAQCCRVVSELRQRDA